jgi:amino acid transporter
VLFIIVGLYGLFSNPNISQLSFHDWESPIHLLVGGMVIFVAYEGFELIANAVPDINNPVKNIPRSYYVSVLFVILLYIIIAIVTVGSLPFKEIASAQDYVLAEAAKPILGNPGFIIITIAALISTFSAINASLLGGSRVNYEIGEDDELPHQFTYKLWNKPIGLAITSIATLIATNLLTLKSISTAGSVGFIVLFASINLAGVKLSRNTNSIKLIPLIGVLLCIAAVLVLIIQQYPSNPIGVIVALSIITLSLFMEYCYKNIERKRQNI